MQLNITIASYKDLACNKLLNFLFDRKKVHRLVKTLKKLKVFNLDL